MTQDIQNFYFDKSEPNRSCLLALRDILLNLNADMSETIKYGMPCFLYKGKMFSYLWIERKTNEPYILLVEGKHLNNPALETGNRSRMKVLRINPKVDLPIELINSILNQAIDLYKTGIVKI